MKMAAIEIRIHCNGRKKILEGQCFILTKDAIVFSKGYIQFSH